ncbi:MAG: GNAT family N-acetyltransferase, partial [Rhodospirillales bacterium]|nr:GNAT family N-acetyltransferase [Rhodospirillales bacterium]
ASPADAAAIRTLIAQLGYAWTEVQIAARVAALLATGADPILVAEADGTVCGVLALHIAPMLHHAEPQARITALVVDAGQRGRGVGRMLLAEAEALARAAGCARLELTSGLQREAAHAFYRAQGYAATSLRFARTLAGSG